MVTFKDPEKGVKVTGFVDEVYRDIFTSEVQLRVRSHTYRFKEPVAIRETDQEVVFLYGDVGRGQQDVSDKKLFKAMRQEQFRETVSDTMRRLNPKRIKEIHFMVGAKRPARRRPFLMRGIQADVSAVMA